MASGCIVAPQKTIDVTSLKNEVEVLQSQKESAIIDFCVHQNPESLTRLLEIQSKIDILRSKYE